MLIVEMVVQDGPPQNDPDSEPVGRTLTEFLILDTEGMGERGAQMCLDKVSNICRAAEIEISGDGFDEKDFINTEFEVYVERDTDKKDQPIERISAYRPLTDY